MGFPKAIMSIRERGIHIFLFGINKRIRVYTILLKRYCDKEGFSSIHTLVISQNLGLRTNANLNKLYERTYLSSDEFLATKFLYLVLKDS